MILFDLTKPNEPTNRRTVECVLSDDAHGPHLVTRPAGNIGKIVCGMSFSRAELRAIRDWADVILASD